MADLSHAAHGQLINEIDWNALIDRVNTTSRLVERPLAILSPTTPQSLSTGTFSNIVWGTAIQDTHSGWSISNPGLYTVQLSGTYSITAGVSIASNATGMRYCRIAINGNAISGRDARLAISGQGVELSITHQAVLNVGDTIAAQGRQDSGGALSTTVSADVKSYLDIRKID